VNLKRLIKNFILDKSQRLLEIPYIGPNLNSGCIWPKLANPFKLLLTAFLVIIILEKLPPCGFKNWLYRKFLGVEVGKDVVIGPKVWLDPLFPQLITIEDGAIIGCGSRILTHEFLINAVRIGRVHIGRQSLIGSFSTVRSGITIGEGSIIGMMSFVNKDVPDKARVGGVPIKPIKINRQ